MSSTASTSFSYSTSDLGTSSFFEIFKLTNIGSGKAQVKVNYADPTSSPYSISTSGWNTSSTARRYSPDFAQFSSSTLGKCVCTPEQWPRTTTGVTSVTSGENAPDETVIKSHALGVPSFSSGITTSYQNLSGFFGLEIGYAVEVETLSEGGSGNSDGTSTILEFYIKDTDTNVEHKCDVLIVFACAAECESNNDDEEEGE